MFNLVYLLVMMGSCLWLCKLLKVDDSIVIAIWLLCTSFIMSLAGLFDYLRQIQKSLKELKDKKK